MNILRQTLKFIVFGVVFVFLLLGSKLFNGNKEHGKFRELISPNKANADAVDLGSGSGGGDNEGGGSSSEGSSGCDGSSGP